jgi:aminodeoxyfutalosine deaminase
MTVQNSDNTVLHCAWLINPGQPPRQNVRVTVCKGIVTEIIDCPTDERAQIRPIALLPRFVNAHTHLEFSDIASPLPPPEPFTDWIRSVIRYRIGNAADPDFSANAVRAGGSESATCGVQIVGEITTSSAGTSGLRHFTAQTDGTAISFRELIGFTADRVDEQVQLAQQHIAELTDRQPPGVVPGLSPHAPYSVHPHIVDAVVELAINSGVPVAMHLAETREEIELLNSRTGPFVDFLKSMNLWDASVLASVAGPMDYLRRLAQVPHALAVHCNYLSPNEIRYLGEHPNVAVVYCPRTHAYCCHSQHPWQQLRSAGATVILGTDSRASNPDLSIWKELQHIARQHNAPPVWELLSMITTDAARALGQDPSQFVITVNQPLRSVRLECNCDSEPSLNDALCTASITTSR